MDIVSYLEAAKKNGVSIAIIDGELEIEAPASKRYWLEKLRPMKRELIALLSDEPPSGAEQELPAWLLEPYKPFPVTALPSAVGKYVISAAKAIGCDASFIALPILACLARAIGNKRTIRLKRTWCEPAIIWASIVGKSGSHKTPALQAGLKFLDRLQAESMATYQESQSSYENEIAIYERDFAAWKRSKSTEPPPWKPDSPICNRFSTSDCTIEALTSLLANQSDGLLISRDELAGWFNGLAEYKGGKGSDLGHWLACWSAQPLTVDRKTGPIKMIHVPRAAVSLIGGIQPDVLRTAIGREHMQDGLCARLLLAMPDPQPVTWTEEIVDAQTENAMSKLFDQLLSLEPADNEHGDPEPYPIDLTPEAKTVWIEYFNRHRAEIAGLDDDLAAAWSKLEAYTARFALIFQLCTWAVGEASCNEVDESSLCAAIEVSDWFGNEAKRVYHLLAGTEEDRLLRELFALIKRRGGTITARQLTHSCRKYRGSGEAESALQTLVQLGVGRWECIPTNGRGRPKQTFMLTCSDMATVTEKPESAEKLNSVTVTGEKSHPSAVPRK